MLLIKVYDYSQNPVVAQPLVIDDDKGYVTHKFDGMDTLTFEIQRSNPIYKIIAEEVRVEAFNNRFTVKNIDEHSDFVIVECLLDLDDWRQKVLTNFGSSNVRITTPLNRMRPDGWVFVWDESLDNTVRGVVEESPGQKFVAVVPIDVFPCICEEFDVQFNFNVLTKTVYVKDPNAYTASGEFIMDGLNLREFGFSGNSKDFVTRLYPYGKKDEATGEYLNISSVNNGLEYIDNNQYSDNIVVGSWVDERYTNPTRLKKAAIKRLKTLSTPVRSYTCDVINIGQNISLYKVITLIDRNRKIRVNHQVVEYVEYKDHRLDRCSLAATSPKIGGSIFK